MQELFTIAGLTSLATLTFLEIILGIDNIVFISIITSKLPAHQQTRARTIGIALSLIGRILMLLAVSWLIGLENPLFTIYDYSPSFRDLILMAGGLFLIAKSVSEIHEKLEGRRKKEKPKTFTIATAILQIILVDIVFSFDSILTAIGLVENVAIIICAIFISLVIMLIFSGIVSEFINRHPAMKILAVSFLIMIGMLLVVDALHVHVPRGYVYFAMAFAVAIELINMKLRSNEAEDPE